MSKLLLVLSSWARKSWNWKWNISRTFEKIFLEYRGHYDSWRIKFVLQKEYQLKISRRHITRLLHAQGLYTHDVRPKYRRQQIGCCSLQKSLVNQHFFVKSPNTLWFVNITYIPTAEDTLYLIIYIHAYSRQMIIIWETILVTEILETALTKARSNVGLIIHVD